MANMVFRCHSCGDSIALGRGERVYRSDECPKCGADLRVCCNCRFFDPARSNQCAEPQAEWVVQKEQANFCDYFDPRPASGLSAKGEDPAAAARKKFDDLFK